MTPSLNSRNIARTAASNDLSEAPYTKNLLTHAHPEVPSLEQLLPSSWLTLKHLNETSARLFIGPIPQGWVKTHNRNWYGAKKKYTSRAITFNARPGQSLTRQQLTRLDPKLARDTVAPENTSSTSAQAVTSEAVSTYSVLQ